MLPHPPAGREPTPPSLRAALDAFIATIEATGGCVRDDGVLLAPAADPDWIDLADAYLAACAAIGRTPMIEEPEDEGDRPGPVTG